MNSATSCNLICALLEHKPGDTNFSVNIHPQTRTEYSEIVSMFRLMYDKYNRPVFEESRVLTEISGGGYSRFFPIAKAQHRKTFPEITVFWPSH